MFVVRHPNTTSGAYSDEAYVNDRTIGARIADLRDASAIRSIFPTGVKIASFEGAEGYFNRDGGWAAAAQGVETLLKKVRDKGVEVLAGRPVTGLIKDTEGRTVGVKTQDGTVLDADLVVIASGSWTPATFRTLDLKGKCLATG